MVDIHIYNFLSQYFSFSVRTESTFVMIETVKIKVYAFVKHTFHHNMKHNL